MAFNDRNATITLSIIARDLASGNVGKAISGMDALAKKGGLVGSVMQGVGIQFGMMLNPVMLATRGIGMMTDFLGEAVHAAIDEEANVAKLTTALNANLDARQINTAAIEEAIRAGQRLAFDDNEQRDALALLVARTKDQTQALSLMRQAMDLTRLRGGKLSDNALLLGKVWGGNVAILKRYGIQVDKNATAEEALAQIQAATMGQAETFANSTAGALAGMQEAIGEVTEDIGLMLLPAVKDLAIWIRDDLIPAFNAVLPQLQNFAKFIAGAASLATANYPEAIRLALEFANGTKAIATEGERLSSGGHFGPAATIISDFGDVLGEASTSVRLFGQTLKVEFGALTGIVKGSLAAARKEARRGLADLVWSLKHPLQDAKLGKFYRETIKDGYQALHRAQREGDAVAIAKARAFIDKYKAMLDELRRAMFAMRIYDPAIEGKRWKPIGPPPNPGKPDSWQKPGGKPHQSGGNNNVVNVNFSSAFPPSPSDGQRIAQAITPHIARELARQGR